MRHRILQGEHPEFVIVRALDGRYSYGVWKVRHELAQRATGPFPTYERARQILGVVIAKEENE